MTKPWSLIISYLITQRCMQYINQIVVKFSRFLFQIETFRVWIKESLEFGDKKRDRYEKRKNYKIYISMKLFSVIYHVMMKYKKNYQD